MYDKAKFKNLVHYICAQRAGDPSSLGATKLNKALWVADFRAHYLLENLLRGAICEASIRSCSAPNCSCSQELENEGAIAVKEVNHFGKVKKEYEVKYGTSIDHFSEGRKKSIEWSN